MKSITQVRPYVQWMPIVLLVSYWIWVHLIFPTPFYTYYDPETPYMLNSLMIFKGQRYAYIDHPGTPVEVIGSVLLALTYPAAVLNHEAFVPFTLKNPEIFLTLARAFLTLMSALCAVLLFRFAFVRKTWLGLLTALAVALTFYAFHPLSFTSLVMWSHNSFSFPFGTLLLLLLLVKLRTPQPISQKYIWLFAFCAGALTAVQLYFATWVIGVSATFVALYILEKRGWLQIVRVGVVTGLISILGFIVVTLPIRSQYPRFLTWINGLIFHQGVYGGGATGIISIESLSGSVSRLWLNLPLLFIASGVLLASIGILFFIQRRVLSVNSRLWSVALGLSLQLIATYVLIFKHPGEIYMLGVAAILPILFMVTVALMDSGKPSVKALMTAMSAVVLLSFAVQYVNAVATQKDRQNYFATVATETQTHIAERASTLGKSPDTMVVLLTYGLKMSSPCYALMFGNDYANHVFGQEITEQCPNQMEFNIWSRAIYDNFGGEPSKDFNWDVMILDPDMVTHKAYDYLNDFGTKSVSNSKKLIFIDDNRAGK